MKIKTGIVKDNWGPTQNKRQPCSVPIRAWPDQWLKLGWWYFIYLFYGGTQLRSEYLGHIQIQSNFLLRSCNGVFFAMGPVCFYWKARKTPQIYWFFFVIIERSFARFVNWTAELLDLFHRWEKSCLTATNTSVRGPTLTWNSLTVSYRTKKSVALNSPVQWLIASVHSTYSYAGTDCWRIGSS